MLKLMAQVDTGKLTHIQYVLMHAGTVAQKGYAAVNM